MGDLRAPVQAVAPCGCDSLADGAAVPQATEYTVTNQQVAGNVPGKGPAGGDDTEFGMRHLDPIDQETVKARDGHRCACAIELNRRALR